MFKVISDNDDSPLFFIIYYPPRWLNNTQTACPMFSRIAVAAPAQ